VMEYIYVALGSAGGGVLRYWLSSIIPSHHFPVCILAINICGSFVIGLLNGLLLNLDEPSASKIRTLMMVGFCGGFTTFSSFSLDNFHLLQQNALTKLALNVTLSVVLCIVGVWLGNLISKIFH
jgi:CrcB protein